MPPLIVTCLVTGLPFMGPYEGGATSRSHSRQRAQLSREVEQLAPRVCVAAEELIWAWAAFILLRCCRDCELWGMSAGFGHAVPRLLGQLAQRSRSPLTLPHFVGVESWPREESVWAGDMVELDFQYD